jgi:glycosyltransferase involved in cell wall biosynthesis
MRLIQIIPTIDFRASGPSYSVPMLADALARRGNDVSLLTVADAPAPPGFQADFRPFAQRWKNIPFLRLLWRSPDMRRYLDVVVPGADLVHANGLWLMPAIYPGWAAARANKPLVFSPRGNLSPVALRISSVRKRVFWALIQGSALRRTAAIHVTSEQEYRDCRSFGLRQPIAVIPNGIEIPTRQSLPPSEGRERRLLYMGRLHPIKGLENLLKVWRELEGRFPDWTLDLTGPDERGYQSVLERLAGELGLKRVVFTGPLFGAAKEQAFRNADLFVLPSFSENFGMSVAEALAFGLPVVTTTGTPWAELPRESAGWWVPPDVANLQAALSEAMGISRDVLAAKGARGRAWMARDFSWPALAGRMETFYDWVINGGTPPDTVRLD